MWEERFGRENFFYGESPNDFLRACAPLIPAGAAVLCIAEGEGRNAVFLAERGAYVTAVDFSEAGRAKALRLASQRGVELTYLVSPLQDFDFGVERWDAVVSIFAHLPSAIRQPVYHRLLRSLRRGGRFFIEAYTPAQLGHGTGGPKDLDMLSSCAILRSELPDLTWSTLVERERMIAEGEGHQGLSAVVQGIGER
jgi:SAM-dependent methyltransferase